MKRKRLKINKKDCFLMMLLLSTYPPNLLMSYSFFKISINVIQVILTIFLGLFTIKKKRPLQLFFVIILYYMCLLFSTFIGNKEIVNCLIFIFNTIGMPLLIMFNVVDFKKVIDICYHYFNIICFLNLLYLLFGVYFLKLNPDDCLFFDESNSITIYYIITVVFTIIYCELNEIESKYRAIFIVFVCSIAEIIVFSGTGMIGWLVFLMLYFGSRIYKRNINLSLGILLTNIISILIISFGILPYWDNLFNLLGKDATLTGRVNIWQYAIKLFINSPIFGYGYGQKTYGYFVAHNQILELLVNGGIFLLITFYLIYYLIIKKEKRLTTFISKSRSNIAFKSALVGIGILMLTEVQSICVLFFFLSIYYKFIVINICNKDYNRVLI